jgi:homoserine kinase
VKLLARAPATVANLGPGFDCLALALDLWNDFEVDTDAEPGIEVRGEGAGELADPADNLVIRSAERVAAEAGIDLPSFRLRCVNRVPLARGLGSSATAVGAGVLLGEALAGLSLTDDDRLRLSVDVEGHPDNVAACLLGDLVLVHRPDPDGGPQAVQLAADRSLRPVVLVATSERVSTEEARRALPLEVAFGTAAATGARAALAVVALTERPDLLPVALVDELHEPYRLALAPKAAALHALLRSLGYPVCLAGSGPSLLLFEPPDRPIPDPGPDWEVLRLAISPQGAHLTPA